MRAARRLYYITLRVAERIHVCERRGRRIIRIGRMCFFFHPIRPRKERTYMYKCNIPMPRPPGQLGRVVVAMYSRTREREDCMI